MVGAAIWFGCWFGLWIAEGLIFPNSNGAIGATIGFFGGAYLGGRAQDFVDRRNSPPPT